MKLASPNNCWPPVGGLTPHIAEQSRKRRKLMAGLVQQQEHRGPPRNDLSPKLTLEIRPIVELKSAARRVRKHDPVQIARIRASLKTFGCCVPVLVTEGGEIVSGHLVVEAAKSLGLREIYCTVIDHLSPVDVRRLRISLNRLAETGTWDYPELKIEINELAVEFADIFEIPGFDTGELDLILQDDDNDTVGMAADEEIPPVQPSAITRLGDIWRLGPHRLGCGDAKDLDFILLLVAAETTRLCLTDPPYGVKIVGHVTRGAHREFIEGGGGTTKEELYALFRRSFRVTYVVLMEGGLFLPFIDWRGVEMMLQAGRETSFDLLNLIVWGKTNAGMGSLYRSHHELCPVFKKGTSPHINNISLGRNGRYRTNLWTYPGASSLGSEAREGLKVHPTVKPVAMLEDAILDVTNRGDIVFDPFSGSGSTLIAFDRCGRIFRGSELDPLYVDVILRRWSSLMGEQPILEKTGETFDVVAASGREVTP